MRDGKVQSDRRQTPKDAAAVAATMPSPDTEALAQ
jgi:hypothetical protein